MLHRANSITKLQFLIVKGLLIATSPLTGRGYGSGSMLFHNYLSILKFNEDIVMTCKKVVVAIVDNEVVGKNCSLLYGGEEWIVAIIHIILTIQRGWVLGCNKNRVAFTIIPALLVDISVVDPSYMLAHTDFRPAYLVFYQHSVTQSVEHHPQGIEYGSFGRRTFAHVDESII